MVIETKNIFHLFLGIFIVFFISGCLPSQKVLQTMLEQKNITQKIYIKNDVEAYDNYKVDKKISQVLKRGEEYNIIDIKENFIRLEKNENNNLKNDVWVSFDDIETQRTYFLTLTANPSSSIIMINNEIYEPNKRLLGGNYKINIRADKYLEESLDIELNQDIKMKITLDFDIEAEKKRIAIKKIEAEKLKKEKLRKKRLKKEKLRKEKIKKERREKLYIDEKQNLIWQDDDMVLKNKKIWITEGNYNNKKYFDTKGDTATTYCKKLTLGDFKDWRLPTKDELKNLSLQKEYLKNVASNWYWSATTNSMNSECAWSIYFDNSDGYADFKNVSNYVRCVRNK